MRHRNGRPTDVKTFVITLRRTPQRLEAFRASNSRHHQIEVFEAVDGQALGWNSSTDPKIIAPDAKYSRSALGCALSHRALWTYAIESGEAVTICEDDAVLHRDFLAESRRLIDPLGTEWDLFQWGWNFDAHLVADILPRLSLCGMRFDQEALRANWKAYIDEPLRSSAMRLHSSLGIPCYSISPRGAKRFLEGCFPLRNFVWTVPGLGFQFANTGIDVAMCPVYANTLSYVSFPPLAVSENIGAASTVQRAN